MTTKLRDFGRWAAFCGLWCLIGLLVLVTYPLHRIAGLSLAAIERLRVKADELRRA